MENIDHIIYLMLENRSLDNVLGWLYETEQPQNFIPPTNTSPFNGLQTGNYYNPKRDGTPVPAAKVKTSEGQTIPGVDPNEEFQNVQKQISHNAQGDMMGFYIDYTSTSSNKPEEIMECYTRDSLPVINDLAAKFAVSDAYYSSIPTQTNCNRAFSLTGNSIGYYYWDSYTKGVMVNNYWSGEGMPYQFTEPSVWDVLTNHGYGSDTDWLIFYNQTWPGIGDTGNYCFTQDLLWPTLGNYGSNKFQTIDQFYDKVRNNQLPRFSFLEPTWFEYDHGVGHNGNDYHPPGNTACGEQFLYKLYNALKSSPNWARTLLIINFDEHGGTYDHVNPMTNRVSAPWSGPDGTTDPRLHEVSFDFKTPGVRVPLILISPLIREGTVIRSGTNIPFDHTSVIATVLNHFRIPKSEWRLGSRTVNAPTFESVIQLAPARARVNVEIARPLLECDSNNPPEASPLQRMIMHRYLSREIQRRNYPVEQAKAKMKQLHDTLFSSAIVTMEHLNQTAKLELEKMELEKPCPPKRSFWSWLINFFKWLFRIR